MHVCSESSNPDCRPSVCVVANSDPPDQSATSPNDSMGCHDFSSGRQATDAWRGPVALLADHGDENAGDCRACVCDRPTVGYWANGIGAGGAPDTTIVILDRSASMEQQDVQTGESKRASGLGKVAELIRTHGAGTHIVLVESGSDRAQSVESADQLTELTDTGPTDTGANITAMLQTALDYVVTNQTGRTDIWICSDLQVSDWAVDDGRWSGLREGFGEHEGVRFYLLSYAEIAAENISVWVSEVRRRSAGQSAELVFDVKLRAPGSTDAASIPLEFVINGARSVLNVKMAESEYLLQGHTVPLDDAIKDGWGEWTFPPMLTCEITPIISCLVRLLRERRLLYRMIRLLRNRCESLRFRPSTPRCPIPLRY